MKAFVISAISTLVVCTYLHALSLTPGAKNMDYVDQCVKHNSVGATDREGLLKHCINTSPYHERFYINK